MVSSGVRILWRHFAVLYVLCTCYCVHRNKLFGPCNPLNFVGSQNGVRLRRLSQQLLAGENIDVKGLKLADERAVCWTIDPALSSVRWVIDCGWREYVTYVYCENADVDFLDKCPNLHFIGRGWYVERVK